jgi:hypothetical protein
MNAMKKIKFVLFACILLAGFACQDENEATMIPEESENTMKSETIPDEPESNLPETGLKGTKWKLAGIADVKTGTLTALEPKDCAECYTLVFDTDYTASGRSITRNVTVNLLDLNPYRYIEDIYYDEGYKDGHDFRTALLVAGSFTATEKELKFFYHDKAEYRYKSLVINVQFQTFLYQINNALMPLIV